MKRLRVFTITVGAKCVGIIDASVTPERLRELIGQVLEDEYGVCLESLIITWKGKGDYAEIVTSFDSDPGAPNYFKLSNQKVYF